MKQKVITQNTLSDHLLSQGVVCNGLIFVSGQVHVDNKLNLVGETTKEKVSQIMSNIQDVLSASGAKLDDIVKVTIYVTDMSVMPDLNEVYPTFFADTLPAREAVCVSALPLGATIEMSVIAEQK